MHLGELGILNSVNSLAGCADETVAANKFPDLFASPTIMRTVTNCGTPS